MEAHVCNHPMVPHTVTYGLSGEKKGTTVDKEFGQLEDATRFANRIINQNPERLVWIQIHRSDNRLYTCFSWENRNKMATPEEDVKVKLEVDMEPLAEAFENVALGFKNQGKSIRRLQIGQAGLVVFFVADVVVRSFG